MKKLCIDKIASEVLGNQEGVFKSVLRAHNLSWPAAMGKTDAELKKLRGFGPARIVMLRTIASTWKGQKPSSGSESVDVDAMIAQEQRRIESEEASAVEEATPETESEEVSVMEEVAKEATPENESECDLGFGHLMEVLSTHYGITMVSPAGVRGFYCGMNPQNGKPKFSLHTGICTLKDYGYHTSASTLWSSCVKDRIATSSDLDLIKRRARTLKDRYSPKGYLVKVIKVTKDEDTRLLAV